MMVRDADFFGLQTEIAALLALRPMRHGTIPPYARDYLTNLRLALYPLAISPPTVRS